MIAAFGLALVAASAKANNIVLTFGDAGDASTNCRQYQTQDGLINYSRPVCHTSNLAYIAEPAGSDPGVVILAQGGATFDLIRFDLIWSRHEIFSIDASILPPGVDPTTPEGYDWIWGAGDPAAYRWEFTPQENLQMFGYLGGSLVQSGSWQLPDTNSGDPATSLPNSTAPFGGMFTGLDQLRIANMADFADAAGYGVTYRDGRWYTCLENTCGFIVIDNILLDVHPADSGDTDDAPNAVPLPSSAPLLLAGLAVAAILKRRA